MVMTFRIMEHRVVRRYPVDEVTEERLLKTSAYGWAMCNAGVMDQDIGDWFMTSWADFYYRTDIYRFADTKTAMMFKLMWG
jgi:hypothetical protein